MVQADLDAQRRVAHRLDSCRWLLRQVKTTARQGKVGCPVAHLPVLMSTWQPSRTTIADACQPRHRWHTILLPNDPDIPGSNALGFFLPIIFMASKRPFGM
jgi:hypothetical protein